MVRTRAVRLEDIASVNPRLSQKIDPSTLVSFVGMADLSADRAVTEASGVRPYSDVAKGYTAFQDGDLLVAKITPCFENGKIGQARLSHRLGFGSTEFHVVRPHPELADARFLMHFLRSPRFRAAGEMRMTGSGGQRRVPADYINQAQLYLPPLHEQRRIAAVLDKADELRAKRRQALVHLDGLTESIFHASTQVLSEKDAVPLADLCVSIQTGPFGSLLHREDYVENGVPLINPMHIISGQIRASPDFSVAAKKFDELRSYHLEADDIVIARRGEMGRCALVGRDQLPLLCGTGSMIVRPDSHAVSPRYLQQVLSSPSIRRRLEDVSQGVTMSNLNGKILSRLRVRMPKLASQRQFADEYSAIEQLKNNYSAQLTELDALFAALQHRAFQGEL